MVGPNAYESCRVKRRRRHELQLALWTLMRRSAIERATCACTKIPNDHELGKIHRRRCTRNQQGRFHTIKICIALLFHIPYYLVMRLMLC